MSRGCYWVNCAKTSRQGQSCLVVQHTGSIPVGSTWLGAHPKQAPTPTLVKKNVLRPPPPMCVRPSFSRPPSRLYASVHSSQCTPEHASSCLCTNARVTLLVHVGAYGVDYVRTALFPHLSTFLPLPRGATPSLPLALAL